MSGLSRAGVLVCEECGERTVLDGPLSAWCSNGDGFGCGCGERSTTAVPPTQDPGVSPGGLEPRIAGDGL